MLIMVKILEGNTCEHYMALHTSSWPIEAGFELQMPIRLSGYY